MSAEWRAATAAQVRHQLDDFLDSLAIPADSPAWQQAPPKKWSAREHLAHLARYREIFLGRMRAILKEDSPQFTRYRAEDDFEWPKWRGLPVEESRRRCAASRNIIVTEIERLTEGDTARKALHPVYGAMPLRFWVEFFLAHEGHHLYQVLMLVHSAPKSGVEA